MIEERNPAQDPADVNLDDFLRFLTTSDLPETCRFLCELREQVDFIKDSLREYAAETVKETVHDSHSKLATADD